MNPIASDPQIAIDSNTGLITGMPNLPGQYAFAVCVSEYRDGVFLGSHQREFQFNVTFCDPNIEATIEDQGFRPIVLWSNVDPWKQLGEWIIL